MGNSFMLCPKFFATVLAVWCSVTVVIQSQVLYPFGESEGDTQLAAVNDGASPEVTLSQGFPYYGSLYSKLYVNTNGLLSFENAVSMFDESERIPLRSDETTNYVLIAPYWSDIDLTAGGDIYYRQLTSNETLLKEITDDIKRQFISERDFQATWAMIVTWDSVKYNGGSSSQDENTFQVVMATDGHYSFVLFFYERLDWSGNEPVASPLSAQAGFNAGDLVNFYTLPGSLLNTVDDLATTSNIGINGQWVFRVDTTVTSSPCPSDLCAYPTIGTMFGGEIIAISGLAFNTDDDIVCKFGEYPRVNGTYISQNEIQCVTPPFFGIGVTRIVVSLDGGATFEDRHGEIYIQTYDRLDEFHLRRVNTDSDDWNYAGRPLMIEWDHQEIEDPTVSVEVVAYREDGVEGPRWEYVYTIISSTPNDGVLTFTPAPQTAVTAGTDYGTIRLFGENKPTGRMLWAKPHALGYVLEPAYQSDPYGWSIQKCEEFYQFDLTEPDFIEGLLPCPCTLQQALVDTGRWQPDDGCSMFKGSRCTYHVGALHCVRSVIPTNLGGGNQCCYDDDGNLMFALDTDQGSTPDRYHTWGSAPYNQIGRVPSTSHWLVDVITFYYCCLWGDHCWKYMTVRATKDCIEYEPPRPAAVFGDPHFTTLDGLNYTFNDKGEFTLIKTTDDRIELQGRFEQITDDQGNEVAATVLTAIAVQDKLNNADKVEVRLAEETTLELLINGETVDFGGQEWLDFSGIAIQTPEREPGDNVTKLTIMLERGFGIELDSINDMMSLQFLLPPTLKNMITGLFGNWNDDPSDDLRTPDGTVVPADSTPEDIFYNFGRAWEITNTDMFEYDQGKSHDDYHDPTFVPLFEPPSEDELSPELRQDMDEVCGENLECQFDVRTTKRIDVGSLTKEGADQYDIIRSGTEKVVVCEYLKTPLNGTKTFKDDLKTHLVGSVITFGCDEGFVQTGTPTRECLFNGKWTGIDTVNDCVETGCGTLLPPDNGAITVVVEDGLYKAYFTCEDDYKISGASYRRCVNGVWTGLETECYVGIDPDLARSLIIGLSCAVGVALIVIVVYVIYVCHFKDDKKSDVESGAKASTEVEQVKYENNAVAIDDEGHDHSGEETGKDDEEVKPEKEEGEKHMDE